MKKIILLFGLVGMSAQAADRLCGSVWFIAPYGTCQASGNNYDFNAQPIQTPDRELESGWMRNRPHSLCQDMENNFNNDPQRNRDGLRVQLIINPRTGDQPTHEKDSGKVGTQYDYYCSYNQFQFPLLNEPNRSCNQGAQEPIQFLPIAPTRLDASRGDVSCLSCDPQFNDPNAPAEAVIDCLNFSFRNVISTPLVSSVNPQDLHQVAVVTSSVLNLYRNRRVPHLSLKEQADMQSFVDQTLNR